MATTADCWGAGKKVHLWLTVHWLNSETRRRESRVLACMRLNRLSPDILTQTIKQIHTEFEIDKKVTLTTMDNSHNFTKSFVRHGEERSFFPFSPYPTFSKNEANETEIAPESATVAMETDDDDVSITFASIDDMLTMEEKMRMDYKDAAQFAGRIKCGAHMWNQVASEDYEKAFQNFPFSETYMTALERAKALWNNNSLTASASYRELNIIAPSDNRWDTLLAAIVSLNKVLEENKDDLHLMMIQEELTTFDDKDVIFLAEYAKVMQPVATALNILQGNGKNYLGWLLPLFATTVIRLNEVKSKELKYCGPLVEALLTGTKNRFEPFLDSNECVLASAFHPR